MPYNNAWVILHLFYKICHKLLKVFLNMEKNVIEKLKEKINSSGEKFILNIKVIAGAKKNSIEEYEREIIKIKINKPAVEGKANKAIIEYLSEILNIPKNNISILKGEKNSLKSLQIIPKSPIINHVKEG